MSLRRQRRSRSSHPRPEALEERSLLAVTALGSEFQVNTTVANDQRMVAFASHPQSQQVVAVWASNLEDLNGDGIYAQRFDLAGNKIGAAFKVNSTTSGNQTAPSAAMDAQGNFVVVWQSPDGTGNGIYARKFTYDAYAAANDFKVSTQTSGSQDAPAVAMSDTGAFAVAWHSASRDASDLAVVMRFYNASGGTTTNDVQVNTTTAGSQQAPSVGMSSSGSFVIAWQSPNQANATSADDIVARRFSSTGSGVGVEFVVNSTPAGAQRAPSVGMNPDGSFVIAWQSANQDTSGNAIVARRYNASGVSQGVGEFIVNQTTTSDQTNPSVSAMGSAGFVVAWQSTAQDGNLEGIVARPFTSAGAAIQGDLVVNTFTTGDQLNPAVAMQADGDFIVGWQSPGQETGGGSTLGVFARRYSAANDAPVLKQIANKITDVGGTIAFTAVTVDQDLPVDVLTYSLAAGAPAGASINPATGEFSWNTTGAAPGRYFATVEVADQAGLIDRKEVALTVFAPGERTVLDDYVNTIDSSYKWDLRSRVDGDGYTKYNILLTSGTWRTAAEVSKPLWEHWMVLYVPDVITQDKALLFIDGGTNSLTPPTSAELDQYAGPVAVATGAVFVDLFSIPSQPLTFAGVPGAKTEDQIIAYSWKKYVETGDPTWPVNLPMTRAAMRAMDATMDFLGSPLGGNFDLDSFIVAGGSKRGWTTWLAMATDPRVSAGAPIVADLLNMEESFAHHYSFYNGTFSAAVNDYVAAGILNVNMFGMESIHTLLGIVDPYTYKDRLTAPKFMIYASGDEFFVPDSWQYYYNDLPGPKAIRYLPNTGHGVSDPLLLIDAINVLNLFLIGDAIPEYSFTQLSDGTIELTTDATVLDAKFYQANNPTKRDFRFAVVGAAFNPIQLDDLGGGVYRGTPTTPPGWTASFIQMTVETASGGQVTFSSGLYFGGPPANIQPDMQPISDYVINEGSPLSVQVVASDSNPAQSLAYSLYTGAPPQVSINSTSGLLSGLWTDQTSGPIKIIAQVYDNGTPPLPDRKTFRVTVLNVAPTASLAGSASVLAGQNYVLTLSATDPSSVDQAAGFTYRIDWNGDGVVDQTVSGASGLQVNHAFATPGDFNVRVTATDKDAGTSVETSLNVTVVNPNSPPVDPHNTQPITIFEGDTLALSATGWTDPNNNPLTYTWDVDGDGQFDDATGPAVNVSWATLVSLGLSDGPTSVQARLRVDDGAGGVTLSDFFTVTINNTAPTALAGGPYAVSEGGVLALLASAFDPAGAADPLSYSWDINGDGVFGDVSSANPTLTWSQLVALGINSGPSSYQVSVRVSDGDGGVTTSDPVTLTVNNAAPVAGVTGPTSALRGTLATFTLTATDASAADAAAGYDFAIDWGDGSPVEIVTGASGTTITHRFDATGPLTVSVTATDVDGDTGIAGTRGIQVDAIQFRPNATNPLLLDLVWGGTTGDDEVAFDYADGLLYVHEQKLNGAAVGNSQSFSDVTGRVIAYGNPGNDVLNASALQTIKATLDGGGDNNTLYGGNAGDLLIGGSNGGEGQQGNNVIIGGSGDDVIYGNDLTARKKSSGGNNLILGGAGNDTIYGNFGENPTGDGGEGGNNLIVGGAGEDVIYASQIVDGAEGGDGSLMIGGETTLGVPALQQVLAEWSANRIFANKVANIQGTGTPDRLNGNTFLQAGATVLDDGARDQFYSDTNGDPSWLLYSFLEDDADRVKATDISTDLD